MRKAHAWLLSATLTALAAPCVAQIQAQTPVQSAPAVAAPAASAADTGAGPDAADDTAAAPTVAVNGARDPEWKPYRQMLKGIDAYEAGRALAPQAPLRFSLQGDEAALAGATLRIVGDSASLPIALAPDHTFTLPRSQEAADEEAEVVLNRKKNLLRWRTEIHSPGVPEHARRLGDLRLSCAVNWAILQDDLGFFKRHAVNLMGGLCGSRLVHIYWPAAQPLASATLVEGERRLPLALRKDGAGFTAPLSDQTWSNEALVLLENAPAQQ